jgi:pimeloyl-ACP methyl ester carboxylesterase
VRHSTILAMAVVFLLATAGLGRGAHAEEVLIDHDGLDLVGQLEIAPGKSLAGDGVVLLLHGTLGHHRMELIASLQEFLRESGVNSLAVTLSLGLNERRGMFDCTIEQDHRHDDAVNELDSWISWLGERGAKSITLAGHSRGANQVALYLARAGSPLVKRAVLIAPPADNADTLAQGYESRFRTQLAPLMGQAEVQRANAEGEGGSALIEDIGFLLCPQARVTADAFLNYYTDDRRFLTPALLANVKLPVLVVIGDQDEGAGRLQQAIQNAALGQNISFGTLAGADHFFRDLYAEDLANEIAKFVGAK